jgi:GT2 family glycosyltransferase/ADP-heptose:LPS heptosyltransferase/lipoprotein NlpI
MIRQVRNIVISGTNFWNPGDDFVRDGVIAILRELMPDVDLNFLFYNFNADFFPHTKFAGISNTISQGNLEQFGSHVDAIVVAGLSAGEEIKDLYTWIIKNKLLDRIYLIGAGYENSYVERYISSEPEATIFKNARIIIGRTRKTPRFIPELNLPYHHINCPAILSVPAVKDVPAGKKIETIGFSIQLFPPKGIVNHSCAEEMYKLATNMLIELSRNYAVEVVAHHKSEYFHYLNLLKTSKIPVHFSSFYQDLFMIYPRYDLVVTTRLHSSLVANGFGIPDIILNDTDRHTHTLEGFPHSAWVNDEKRFIEIFKDVLNRDLAAIARDANTFKRDLMQKYCFALADSFNKSLPCAGETSSQSRTPIQTRKAFEQYSTILTKHALDLPIHFFTIVLNGEPFIRRHIDAFRKLQFPWHWHVIEGVADHRHDTAWSIQNGGRITPELHRKGLSKDGTTEYIDLLKKEFPSNITIYRKGGGQFWDGKLEMVNAPLSGIGEECLLWQIDADEVWTTDQISRARALFLGDSVKTAAFYTCKFFVGPDLVITSRNTYGNHRDYEWLRTWRFRPGDRWMAHEPPQLCRWENGGQWVDLAKKHSFRHEETESAGLIFNHYAYVTEQQLRFKEVYYGYTGAVQSWKTLQAETRFPALLKNYFSWVNDDSIVNRHASRAMTLSDSMRILWVRTDAIGDNILASSMLPHLRKNYPQAKIIIVCQDHIAGLYEHSSAVDEVISFDRSRAMSNKAYRDQIGRKVGAVKADAVLNPVYSRDSLNDFIALSAGAALRIAWEGDASNMPPRQNEKSKELYSQLIPNTASRLELLRHRDFLRGLGLECGSLELDLRSSEQDREFALGFFKENHLTQQKTIAFFGGSLLDIKRYERYGAALAGFCADSGFSVLCLGGEADSALYDRLSATISAARVVNLAGKTTLCQAAELIRLCRLALGSDTGLAHIACAVKIPNVVLMGGGHFGRFFPYSPSTFMVCLPLECYGCNWQCRYERAHCIQDISGDVIAEAMRHALDGPSDHPRVFVQGTSQYQRTSLGPRWRSPHEYLDLAAVHIIPVGDIPAPVETLWRTLSAGGAVREAEKLYREQSISRHEKAMQFAGTGCIGEAVDELERLLDEDPDFVVAHNDLGVLRLKQNEQDKALFHFQEAVLRQPKNTTFRKNLADYYYRVKGRYDDAVKLYLSVLKEDPKDFDVLVALGQISLTGGLLEHARRYLMKALEIDPMNGEIMNVLASLDRKEKETDGGRPEEGLPAKASENTSNNGSGLGPLIAVASEPDAAACHETPYLVSAIVSTYKSGKFMRRKLDDILNQTLAEQIEIIVIDSNSPENEGAIVREYMTRHRNIRYLRTENRETVYQAWNRGIALARGEFITNANTDDRLRRDCIETLVQALRENPDKVLAYGDSIITIRENETFERCTPHGYLRWPDFDRAKLLEFCFVGPHPVWRRSVHEKAGYFDENYQCAADYEFWLRLALNHDFVHVPELLGLYWQNEESVSRKGQKPIDEALRIQNVYRRKFREKEKRFRVLFVAHNFPPFNFAGVEIYTFNLASELKRRGVDVSVFYPVISPERPLHGVTKGSYEGIATFELAVKPENFIASLSHPDKESAFRDLLGRERFDTVHFHHTHDKLPLSLIIVAKQAGLPVALTLHDFWLLCPRTHLYQAEQHTVCKGPDGPDQCARCLLGSGLQAIDRPEQEAFANIIARRRELVGIILTSVDAVTAPSRFLADVFSKYDFGKVDVSPLGIRPMPVRAKSPEDTLIFGYIGTIHELKNVFWLTEVFSSVVGKAHLVIYGSGAPQRIKQLTDSLQDCRIEYRGAYSPGQLPQILADMDCVIVPSLIESYCFTVREALSAGVPVIASRTGGIPEIVTDGENGFLFEPGNADELSGHLRRLIDNPELLANLREPAPVRTISEDALEWHERYLHIAGRPWNAPVRKLKVGFLTAEPHSYACPNLRLQAPLTLLHDENALDLLRLGEISGGRFNIDKDALAACDIVIVQRQFAAMMPYGDLTGHVDLSRQKIVYELDDAFTELPRTHISFDHYSSIRPFIEEYLKKADLVTLSTETLKSYYGSLNSNIEVIQNVIDQRLLGKVPAGKRYEGAVRILFSGTLTHAKDLAMIESAIERTIRDFGEKVLFLFWGNVPGKLRAFRQVQVFAEFTPDYAAYAKRLGSVEADFALIPLEDNAFNQAKSHIKWLEYSACGIPGIYSNVGEYASSIRNNATGLLVENTPGAWYQAIKRLILDQPLREKIAQQAHDEVKKHYTLNKNGYKWLRVYKRLAAKAAGSRPKVSLIIPVFNRIDYTKQCLNALERNTQRHVYEVIIVDNASTDGTAEYLARLEGNQRVIANEKNLGFAKACNQGARAASGEYIIFLNNDTEPQAGWLDPLIQTAEADDLVSAVGSKLLYPDGTIQHGGVVIIEDRKSGDPLIAQNNHVHKPSGAPVANVPFAYQALTAACLLVRRTAFEKAGGFDEGYWNGYEDVDLCFTLQSQGGMLVYQPGSIVIHHESQSGPERFNKALHNIARLHAKWLGKITPDAIRETDGSVRNTQAGIPRPYLAPVSSGQPPAATAEAVRQKIASIVILTFNGLKYTKECVESIRKNTPEPHEIIFVDNGSTDGTVKWLRQMVKGNPRYHLIENKKNLGFSKGCNQGLTASSGEYLLLLNNDVVVTKGWLSGMLECLKSDPDFGIIGPMTNNISGNQKVDGVLYATMTGMEDFAEAFREKYRHRRILSRRIVGFCMLFRHALVEKIGLLDEMFGSGNFEDDDYCLRAVLAGYRNIIAGDVFIHHHGSRSFIGNKIDYSASLSGNKKLFNKKWSGISASSLLGMKMIVMNTVERARELHEQGRLDRAVDALVEAIKHAPDAVEIYYCLAELFLENHKYQEALDSLKTMPAIAIQSERALTLTGFAMEGMELFGDAAKHADRVLAMNPRSAMALNLKGMILYKQGDSAAAERFFHAACEADPGYGEPYTNIGVMKWATGQKAEALTLLEKGFILSPAVPDIGTLYHSAVTDLEQFAAAEKLLRDAKMLYPNNKHISSLLIDSLLKQADHEKAIQEIERAMISFGENDTDLILLGERLYSEGKTMEAMKYFTHIITNPSDNDSRCRAFNNIGVIAHSMNDMQRAEQMFISALDIDSVNIHAILNLSDVYLIQGRRDKALNVLRKAFAAHPGNDQISERLAFVTAASNREENLVPLKEPGPSDGNRDHVRLASSDVMDAGSILCQLEKACQAIETSIVVVVSNGVRYLTDCIESIARHTYTPYQLVFIIDRNNAKTVSKRLKTLLGADSSHKIVVMPKNKGSIAKCYNRAVEESFGDNIVFIHDDVIVSNGWLESMLRHIKADATTGVVGPMTNNVLGVQRDVCYDNSAGTDFGQYAVQFRDKNKHRVLFHEKLAGFCIAVRRHTLIKAGLFDERFESESTMIADLCLMVAYGGNKNIVASEVLLYHHNGCPKGNNGGKIKTIGRDRRVFNEKWRSLKLLDGNNKRGLSLEVIRKAGELWHQDRFADSINLLLDFVRNFPDATDAFYYVLEILIDSKQFKEAINVINMMPSNGPDVKKLEFLGYCKEGLDQYEEAEACADEAVSLVPGSARALNLKGILTYRKRQKTEARIFFNKAIENDPGYGEPYANLGFVSWEEKQVDTALEYFERGFILTPTVTDILKNYHAVVKSMGKYERAESVFRQACALYPINKRLQYLFIDVLIRLGKQHDAMKEIEDAIEKFGVEDGIISAALEVRNSIGPFDKIKDPGKDISVSLCMIVKNEETQLGRCLTNLKSIVDEMIIVDTGSSDKTREIATIFGAKVYEYKWANDFSEARNFSISRASGDWIFVMDADEIISPDDFEEFQKIVSRRTLRPVAYSFVTRNYSVRRDIIGLNSNDGMYEEESGIGWVPSQKVRLFTNRNGISFEYPVHEIVEPSLKKKNIEIRTCKIPVHHYGHMREDKKVLKGEEYYNIGKKKLDEMGGDDVIAIYELAAQAGMLEKWDDAVELWQMFISRRPDKALAFVNLGTAYQNMGRYADAISAARRAMKLDPDMKEAFHDYALYHLFSGNAKEAVVVLEDLVRRFSGYQSAQFKLAIAYLCAGRTGDGIRSLEKLKPTTTGRGLAISCYTIAKKLYDIGKFEYARAVLEGAVRGQHINEDIISLLNQCCKAEESVFTGPEDIVMGHETAMHA